MFFESSFMAALAVCWEDYGKMRPAVSCVRCIGVFKVNAGSLLPALSRMERGGDVKSEWRATEKNRRAKYYLLTAKGRQSLSAETEQWQRQIGAIARILEA